MTEPIENPDAQASDDDDDDGLPPVVQVDPWTTVTRQKGIVGDDPATTVKPGPTADGTTTSPPTLFADRMPQ